MSIPIQPDAQSPQHSNTQRNQPHSKHVVEQFAGMMKQKQSYVDKDHKEAVDDLDQAEKDELTTDQRKVESGRHRTALDDAPSVPKTIHHIQKQLTRLSRIRGQEGTARHLQEQAQKSVDKLKDQGYKVDDLKIPDAD